MLLSSYWVQILKAESHRPKGSWFWCEISKKKEANYKTLASPWEYLQAWRRALNLKQIIHYYHNNYRCSFNQNKGSSRFRLLFFRAHNKIGTGLVWEGPNTEDRRETTPEEGIATSQEVCYCHYLRNHWGMNYHSHSRFHSHRRLCSWSDDEGRTPKPLALTHAYY